MPRKLSPEDQLELESLYRQLAVFGDFLAELSPAGTAAIEGIRRAYDARDLRGLRMARGDIAAMTQAASPAERRRLDAMLRERAGVSLGELSERELRRVRQVRARGKVTSEEQYHLLRERVEFLGDDPEGAEERREIWALLHAFEERACRSAREHHDRAG